MLQFSQDWFSHNIPHFEAIKQVMGGPVRRILEIGAFEGRSTCWMLENMLTQDGELVCLDTFEGSAEHTCLNLNNLFETWRKNVEWVRKETQTVRAFAGPSYLGMAEQIAAARQFDFVYVDGSHAAPDVLTDAVMAFGLTKPGGVLLFDDYLWNDMPGLLNRPKIAIDLFTTIFSEKSDLILLSSQVAIRKR